MQVDFDSIQPETIEHFKGGEGSVTAQAYVDGNNRIMRATVHPHSSIGWHSTVEIPRSCMSCLVLAKWLLKAAKNL